MTLVGNGSRTPDRYILLDLTYLAYLVWRGWATAREHQIDSILFHLIKTGEMLANLLKQREEMLANFSKSVGMLANFPKTGGECLPFFQKQANACLFYPPPPPAPLPALPLRIINQFPGV